MIRTRRAHGDTSTGPSTRYKPVAPASAHRVLREAILARVFSPRAPLIVVLHAPAGHGKSTVLRQIREECAARQVRCGWLNLDESDNDCHRHTTHLQRMLLQLFQEPAPTREAPAMPAAALQNRADWFIGCLDRDARPVALFIDEFEVLTDRTLLAFWRDLLLKLPEHVQVFIAARTSPEIGIPRLTVSDRILVLSSNELRFSEDEVQSFFRSSEPAPFPAHDIQAIHRCTEGWPAAVQLFRLGLSRCSPAEALKGLDQFRPRELADYLTECVLDGLSADIRNFLERTSILNRLHAQVCNALTGRSDSQHLLLRLEKQGLFINAVDEAQLWFRYHSLFATQLREHLLTDDPDKFRRLNRQAATWFFANGIHDDAIHHAVAANDLVFAADILEAWSAHLVADGELSIAERWFDCLPIDEVRKRPLLRRRLAWAFAFLRQPARLRALAGALDSGAGLADELPAEELPVQAMIAICDDHIVRAFETVARVQEVPGELDRFTAFELSAAANLDAFRNIIIGDFRRAELRLATATAYNQPAQAFFSAGYTAGVRGLALLLKGRTSDAIELLATALATQRRALDLPFAIAPLACCYLWALYEANRLQEVAKTFAVYREMVLKCAIPDLFSVGVQATLRTLRLLGRGDDFDALLSEAERLAQQNRWPRIVASLRHASGIAVESAGTSRAGRAADVQPNWLTFEELFSHRRAEPIRLAIAHGRHEEASAALTELLKLRPDCVLLGTRLGLRRALLLEARGLKNPAARQFAASLKLAQESGYVRAVLDEGPVLMRLLDGYLESTRTTPDSPVRRFALGIKAALAHAGNAGRQNEDAAPIDLGLFSEREREIVECLSQRMTNREIAHSAHISENTVKFHLKKIFAKLGVRRRIEAYAAIVGLKRSFE